PAAAAAADSADGRGSTGALRLSGSSVGGGGASEAASPAAGGGGVGAIATAALGATAEHAPGPSVPSLHATEAEHRQRVFEKQRELEAKQKK
ncbi:unnamed protein product, partial [Ectocarpus sp. 12 AP-2014]